MKSSSFRRQCQATIHRTGAARTVAAALALSVMCGGMAWGQQNVFSRSEAGTGDWGSGNNPWYYQTWDNNQGSPDKPNDVTRNDVFIGHNNNTTMTVNGRYYLHRDFTFQSGASTQRTINASGGGGFSFTRKLENVSTATHIFNAPVGIDAAGAVISSTNAGGLRFSGDVFTNNHQTFIQGNGTVEFLGAMTQGGSFVKQGTGTLSFGQNADFSGSVFIDQGVVRVSRALSSNAIDIGAGIQANTGFDATLQFDEGVIISKNITVNNVGTGAGGRNLVFANSSGTASLSGTVGLEKTLAVSGSGNGSMSGVVSGSGNLTKTGSGTLTLSGNNSYTGLTQVNQGTLLINGSQASATGDVSVASGAKLGGTGTIGGATSITGTYAPGAVAAVGTQNFNGKNLTFNSGSIFEWDVAADSSFDKVTGINSLLGSGGIFNIVTNISAPFWENSQTFSDVFNIGTLNDVFSSFQLNGSSLSNGIVADKGTFSFSGNDVSWVPIPEPSTALAWLLLAAGVLRRRR